MAYSIDEYAKDKMKALGIDKAEALVLPKESFSQLLLDGFTTADIYFFMILQDGAVCGWLWFSIKSEWGVISAFVYDLEVVPEYRRQGIGSVAMGLLEAEVKVLGASKIALHVFGKTKVRGICMPRSGIG